MAEKKAEGARAADPVIPSAELRAGVMARVALGPYQEWRRRRAEDRQPRPAPA